MTMCIAPDETSEGTTSNYGTLKLTSEEVLQGLRRVIIDHQGTEYTLHLTKQNKLLLTK